MSGIGIVALQSPFSKGGLRWILTDVSVMGWLEVYSERFNVTEGGTMRYNTARVFN